MKLNKFIHISSGKILNKRFVQLLILFIITVSPFAFLFAQSNQQDYYIFPIRPGEVNHLSGNMGELRSTHFHSGIDIKTGGVVGLPVHAAADGYISRIKMSAWGYGNALYVLHPNGETTVYGHLQRYAEDIANYVREAQYKDKTFEIELFPEKDRFPVSQGEIIGYSGNTGGSGGPHLHFEIRDKNQEALNPLKYNFEEIRDNIAPEIKSVALVTLEKDARVNNLFGRFEFDIERSGASYTLKEPVAVHGKIGIEVLGYDQANGASNRNGIAKIETYLDNQLVFRQHIAKFAFNETRDILVLYDYPTYKKTGRRFYKLFVDDGNQLPFYQVAKENGTITLQDSSTHEVVVNFWDSYENKSTLRFKIFNVLPSPVVATALAGEENLNFSEVYGNVLKVSSLLKDGKENMAAIYANRLVYEQKPDYRLSPNAVYLWDLQRGLPDSILIGNETWKFNFRAMVPSQSTFRLFTPHADIYFPRKSLFDTLYIQTSYWQDGEKEVFGISEDLFPLQRNIAVTLKPKLAYANKKRTHIYRINSPGNYIFEGGEWQNEQIKFNTRTFGDYTLLTDTLPPEVKPLKLSKEKIEFVIADELSGIYSYETFVDGEWLLMHYDYKRNLIWSDRLHKDTPLNGELVLKVKDQAGNEYVFTTKL